jgi:hypothetical protein
VDVDITRMYMPICHACAYMGGIPFPKKYRISNGVCAICRRERDLIEDLIVEEEQYKKVRLELTKEVRECPLEELPLHLNSPIPHVRWIANKRLEAGK